MLKGCSLETPTVSCMEAMMCNKVEVQQDVASCPSIHLLVQLLFMAKFVGGNLSST